MSLEPFLSPELQRIVSVMLIINDLLVTVHTARTTNMWTLKAAV